jgi:hypothetical protein
MSDVSACGTDLRYQDGATMKILFLGFDVRETDTIYPWWDNGNTSWNS